MTTDGDTFETRLQRILTAVHLGTPDRVPVVTVSTIFAANYLGVSPAAFCADTALAGDVMLRATQAMGDVDGLQFAAFSPHLLSFGTLNRVKIPGVDLPADQPYQVDEQELMTTADYDAIVTDGYDAWVAGYRTKNMPRTMAALGPVFGALPAATKKVVEAGLPILSPLIAIIPFEQFFAARSMAKFVQDLFRMPDKVAAACEVAAEAGIAQLREAIRRTHAMGVFLGLGRSNRGMHRARTQERFVYPYIKRYAEAILEEGAIPVLHCDQDWTNDVDLMLDLPKGKCILQLDGASDIFALKKSVGHHICLMGDVQASKLVLGTPEEIHAYCRRLVEEVGPDGFIMSQGCDMPPVAKPENYRAMVASVRG